MADFYCDHENTTLYTTALMAAPTWGQAQDGDGTAYGGGTAPAPPIGSVVFSSITSTPTTGSVSILGSTAIVPTYGATLDAQANNLATAINASTAAVTLTTKAGNVSSAYVKALVYARGPSGGAPAGTCQIMSRIATDAFNSGTNIAVTSWNNITATPSDMRSGVSGPWRYFFNTAALAANVSSSIGAVGTYGAVTATLLGSVAAGDSIHVRTKRSSADITLTWPTTGLTVTMRAIGTYALPLAMVFDNGVKWSGDAGVFVMSMDGSQTANRSFVLPQTHGLRQLWLGTRLTDTTCNWRVEITGVPQAANYTFRFGANINAAYNILDISGVEICGAAGAAMNNTNANYGYVVIAPPVGAGWPRDAAALTLRNSVLRHKGMKSLVGLSGNLYYYTGIRVEDTLFDCTGLTVAADEAIVATWEATSDGKVEFYGCRFSGFPAVANLSGFQKFSARRAQFRLQDCTTTNIKLTGGTPNGGLVGAAEDAAQPFVDQLSSITVATSLGNRSFVFENRRISFAWVDSAVPRTTSSVLPDGTTNFSVLTAVTTESGNVTKAVPARFPRLAKHNTLANGTRTATLRVLVDNNLRTSLGSRDPNNDELWIEVRYVGTDGLAKSVTTRPAWGATPAAITSGTSGDWSATSYDVNGVTHNYTAFEIAVSCPSMQTLTEASLVVCQGFQSSSVDNLIFLDPEWSLV